MTEIDQTKILLDENVIYYQGVKYQKVEEPKSFYDKVWELVSGKLGNSTDADELTDRIMDLIKQHIPTPLNEKNPCEITYAYNAAIKDVNGRFK
jgi:citrate synthase